MFPKLTLTAALLVSASCAANRTPAPTGGSHPPAIDLVCQAEPPALTDDQVMADEATAQAGHGHPNEEAFDDAALLAGRSCRDALRRVCEWHKARGDKDLKCDTAAMSVGELERLRLRLELAPPKSFALSGMPSRGSAGQNAG